MYTKPKSLEKSNSIILKTPPKSVFILSFLIINLWQIVFACGLLSFDILSYAEFSKIFLNFFSVLLFTISGLISYLLYKHFTSIYINYNKDDNSYKKALKAIKSYETLLIILPVLFSFIIPLVLLNIRIPEHRGANIFTSVVMFAMGSCFLLALFFYVFFIQRFEKWIHIIPLHSDFRGMPLKIRSVLTAFFSFTGTILIALAPLVVLNSNSSVQEVIRTKTIPLLCIGMFIGLFDLYLQVNGSASRLKSIVDFTSVMTGRDYTREKLNIISRDEFGFLMNELNEFQNITSKLLTGITTETGKLNILGETLSHNMNKTAFSINQINENIDKIKEQAISQSTSVTETAATMEEIIRTIKQLNNSIENQASSVSESSSAIEQMVSNVSSITATLEKTNSVIKSLSDATEDGKETIAASAGVTQSIAEESGGLMEASSVIQHIASQTNLLAMNAAIEAAHAGEAGKGFAVVADEIRKLAEESSAQGKAITTTLKALSGEIESLSTASKTAEEKFDTIFTLSEQVKDMSSRLMEAMREQGNGSKEVLTAIRDINIVTAQVKDGSAEMLIGSQSVAEEMSKLDKLAQTVTGSINEMALNAAQINKAAQEVSKITQENQQSIKTLVGEVGQFKV